MLTSHGSQQVNLLYVPWAVTDRKAAAALFAKIKAYGNHDIKSMLALGWELSIQSESLLLYEEHISSWQHV